MVWILYQKYIVTVITTFQKIAQYHDNVNDDITVHRMQNGLHICYDGAMLNPLILRIYYCIEHSILRNCWHSIGKGVLFKTFETKFMYILYLNFDVKRFEKYSFSYGISHIHNRHYDQRLYI